MIPTPIRHIYVKYSAISGRNAPIRDLLRKIIARNELFVAVFNSLAVPEVKMKLYMYVHVQADVLLNITDKTRTR